jgi:hypothetical protein
MLRPAPQFWMSKYMEVTIGRWQFLHKRHTYLAEPTLHVAHRNVAHGMTTILQRHVLATLFCRLVAIFERRRPWECRLTEEGQDQSISSTHGGRAILCRNVAEHNFRNLKCPKYSYVLLRLHYRTSGTICQIYKLQCHLLPLTMTINCFSTSLSTGCVYIQMFPIDRNEYECSSGSY